MLQAPVLDGLSFDPFSCPQDGVTAPEVNIGRREIFQALVVAVVIVVVDEGLDLGLQIAGKIVVLKQYPVLQGLVPTLDLALGLRMVGRATNVLHIAVIERFGSARNRAPS